MRCKLGIERQEITNRGCGFGAPAEMPAGRRHHEERPKKSGNVHPVRALEGLLVLALVKMIPQRSKMHPTRMIGVEFHRTPNDRGASLKLACVHDLQTQNPERVGVERIEGHRALGRWAKRR